ncbi:MAG: Uncharacterised protein [Opitutia bacterium UBA7350]|nr:MAG: Uncharacterised protein [Opitutae bacterium UBA7350]
MAPYRQVPMRRLQMIDRLRQHWFTLGLFGVVIVSLSGFGLPLGTVIIPIGVWIIFLAQGVILGEGSPHSEQNWCGTLTFVLCWNFLLFPLVTVGLLWVTGLWEQSDFAFGYWLLAFLPTTIASAVAMTSGAGGRVEHALLATVSSNLFAVWLVPMIAVFYLAIEAEIEIALWPLVLRLLILIVLPLLIGYGLRRFQFPGTAKLAGVARPLTQGILLLILLVAFSRSFTSGELTGLNFGALRELLLVCGALVLLVSALVWFSAGRFHFSYHERISVFYCASQKSLATGVPMIGSVLLAVGPENASAINLLPILCYSPMQLLLGGYLVPYFSRQ